MLRFFLLFLIANIGVHSSSMAEALLRDEHELERYSQTIQTLDEQNKMLDESKKNWVRTFKERAKFHNKIIDKLSSIESRLSKPQDHEEIYEDYTYVLNLWRSFVKNSFSNISGEVLGRKVPKLISYENFTANSGVTDEQIKELELKNSQLIDEFSKQSRDFEFMRTRDSFQYNKILLASSKLRSKLYKRLVKSHELPDNQLFSEALEDLWREIKIIPVRWTGAFYSKLLEVNDNINAGATGYLLILEDLSVFFFLVIASILFTRFFNALVDFCEGIAESGLKILYREKRHWLLQYVLTLVNRSIPWIFLLLALIPLRNIINQTSVRGLTELIPYLEYYVCYRLILIITTYTIIKLKSRSLISISYLQQVKLLRSFAGMYRFVIINKMILYTINAVVGEAILYNICFISFVILGIIYILAIIDNWRVEMVTHIYRFAPDVLINAIRPHLRRFYAPLISFVCFIYIFGYYCIFFVQKFLSKFDFSQKLSAKIFLAQIQSTNSVKQSNNSSELPLDYVEKFSNREAQSEFAYRRTEFEECYRDIDNWLHDDSFSRSVVVYGSYGSGKSILVNNLAKKIGSDSFKILHFKTKTKEVATLLSELRSVIGGEAEDVDGLIKGWSQSINNKIVICIEDAHNLFFSYYNGFEVIKTLIRIINSDIKNIYWCVTFHSYSWSYINKVLSKQLRFDKIVEIQPWSSAEIHQFIMARHKETNYELSFDEILFMNHKRQFGYNIDHLLDKFFNIIKEQSQGNPFIALRLWLTSLSHNGSNILDVFVPLDNHKINFTDICDDAHFIFAALMRHENLSINDIKSVTNLEEGVILKLLKVFLNNKLLAQDENKDVSLNKDYVHNIEQTLKRKNYVY